MKQEQEYAHAELVRRIPSRPSEQKTGDWNQAEMVAGHTIAIRPVRVGVRSTEVAAGLAAYRERIIERIRKGGDVEEMIADIRAGVLR